MLTLHCWLTEPMALQPHSCKHHAVCHTIHKTSQHFSNFSQDNNQHHRHGEQGESGIPSQPPVLPQRPWLRGRAFSPEGPGVRTQWGLWKACLYGFFSLAMTMLLALTSAQRVGCSSLLLQPKQPRHDFSDQIPPLMRTAEAVTALTLLYIVSVLH